MQESISVHDAGATNDNRARYPLTASAIALVLAWSLLTLTETPRYLHDPGIPSWQPVTLVSCSIFVMLAGLAIWMRCGQFDRIDLDEPRQWFARQLRRLPLIIIGAIVLIYGLRYLVFTLAGTVYSHIEWPLLLTFEAAKVSVFFCLWLGIAFGVRSFHEYRDKCRRVVNEEVPATTRSPSAATASAGKLLVPDGERLQVLDTETIQWVEAAGNYAMVHAIGRDFLLRRTLQSLLSQLGEHRFARIHKSALVNLDAIAALHPLFKGDYEVELKSGKRLRLSRRYRAALFSRTGS